MHISYPQVPGDVVLDLSAMANQTIKLGSGLCQETWVALVVLGVVPLAGWLLWWLNDIWFTLPVKIRWWWSGEGGTARLPPGHMGIPFIGETINFLWYFKVLRRPDDFINSKRRRYGDGEGIYRTHLLGTRAIITCSPMINKYIFQSESDFMLEWPTPELVGSSSIIVVHGSAHARIRSYVTRAINQPEALRKVAVMVQPRIIAELGSWAQTGRVVAHKYAKKVTFQNIAKLFANLEPGSKLDTLEKLLGGILLGTRAYPINIPGTSYHYAVQCRRKAEAIFKEVLEKRRKVNLKNEDGGSDLLGGLIKLKDDEGKPISDKEVIDNIVTLVLGGYESTTLALMWAVYYLAKYPKVLQKLRDENISLSKSKNGELITADDISKLKYTNKVVEETIRMANIAAFVYRTATRDIEYKGYIIPKGWRVYMWIRYMHTNAENFTDPMCFNPDRWDEPAKCGTYQVFGGGSRICAGNMLARIQVAIFLHHLSTGYKWELVNPEAGMVYLPHPKPADGVEIFINKL